MVKYAIMLTPYKNTELLKKHIDRKNKFMNGFSNQWNSVYKKKLQLTSWPWSDLVSLVYKYCEDSIKQNGVVFELGCGAGPNIPFIQSLGMEYYGVDGSKEVVDLLHGKFPDLKNNVSVGDFTDRLCYTDLPDIDIIIDRAAVTHNDLSAITKTIENSLHSLKRGGYFIGIDWFSTKHSGFEHGLRSGDTNTRAEIEEGPFAHLGKVHFSDEKHLRSLFIDMDIIHLEEKVINFYEPKNRHQFSSWNIVAKRDS
jgi:SAM-dependent methyltransferase